MNPGFPPVGPDGHNPIWEMVKQSNLDPAGTMFLLMQMPDFVEDEDMALAKKNYPVILRNLVLGTILGITVNVQLKRIPNFLQWNRFLRIGTRIPAFFMPFGIFYPDTKKRIDEMHNSILKYQKRFLHFQKTGDFKYLDPQKKLEKKFMEKMV